MVVYTDKQRKALEALKAALDFAVETGTLEKLELDCASPDSINDVIDAVEYGLEPQ